MAIVPYIPLSDIKFGERLWELVRESNALPSVGAFWLLEPELNQWRLFIATPLVDKIGPRDAYARLWQISPPHAPDQVMRTVLISPNIPLYKALRSVFGKTASVEGARLGNTQVGGIYIDDAYLYEIR